MPGLHTGLNTRPALCILHLRRINANYNLIAHLRSLRAQGLTKLRINEKSEILFARLSFVGHAVYPSSPMAQPSHTQNVVHREQRE